MTFNDVLNWLKDNWQFVVTIAGSLVSLILIICKKNKNVIPESIWVDFLSKLPSLINDAEATNLQGDEKLRYVVAQALQVLAANLGDSVFSDKVLVKMIITEVENILSTPQKK